MLTQVYLGNTGRHGPRMPGELVAFQAQGVLSHASATPPDARLRETGTHEATAALVDNALCPNREVDRSFYLEDISQRESLGGMDSRQCRM